MTHAPTTDAPGLDQVVLGNPSYVWRFGQERRLAMLRRYMPLENTRVLDIGCGLGAYVNQFAKFTNRAYGMDIDHSRTALGASRGVHGLTVGVGEALPFADGVFDGIMLNEVLEHVTDDHAALREALRVLRPGGRIVIFVPNRLYPMETHGIYLGKKYIFGNIPLINWLPTSLRNKLVPHARAYTRGDLERITRGLPGRWVDWTVIYPGFDNIIARTAALGQVLRRVMYTLEHTELRRFGLSHLLVLERT